MPDASQKPPIETAAAPAAFALEDGAPGELRAVVGGAWRLAGDLPARGPALARLREAGGLERLVFESGELGDWDSSLLVFLTHVLALCEERRIEIDRAGLPEGLRKLLDLAAAVPERSGARRSGKGRSPLARLGTGTLASLKTTVDGLAFLGEATRAIGKLAVGKARFSRSDLLLLIQDCGAAALPIVSLISVLVGLILAFVGAVQLRLFGAELYIANLVGLGMLREMGAMMTGIIMAGRTGAAFAAKLGTMQVNEEIDALETLGIPPMEYLVLPRLLALCLMMPLLCICSDAMGLLGGGLVGIGLFDISPSQYLAQTQESVSLVDAGIGIVKSICYGVIIAFAGCFRGLRCGRSASAVGDATTSAVVTAIVWIVVACAVTTVICDILRL